MTLHRSATLLAVVGLLLVGLLPAATPVRAAEACFAETSFCVQGRFLDYWSANGGLARNGYPLSAERREVLEDGREYTVQYFERVRLEYHPENAPPYDVLLGQFGRAVLAEADLLGGELGRLYITDASIRDRLGRPQSAATQTPGATQPFERGRMLYGERVPFYGQDQRPIFVLVGEPDAGRVLNNFETLALYFTDTWREGQPVGGGPGPQPGLSEPTRGFGKVWRENDRSEVREALGYATAPEVGYTVTVQGFERGVMLIVTTAEGRFIYVIDIRRGSNASASTGTYQRYPLPPR